MAKTPEIDFRENFNKNYIINGDMQIAQRNTTFTSPASGSYTLDRYRYANTTSATHTITQGTDVPTFAQAGHTFVNNLRLNLTAADNALAATDECEIQQRIEGYNWLNLSQKSFTLSFWVKATLPGTYCVSFRNNGQDRSYVAEYVINASATWEYKTITVTATTTAGTWDYSNNTGLSVTWTIAAGSNFITTAGAWQVGNFLATSNQVNGVATGATDFRLTGIMLNEGASALGFKLFGGDFASEVRACQRYYEKSYPLATVPGTATATGSYMHTITPTASTIAVRIAVPMKVTKRSDTVTGNVYSTQVANSPNHVSNDVASEKTISFVVADSIRVGFEVSTTWSTDGRMYWQWTVESEL